MPTEQEQTNKLDIRSGEDDAEAAQNRVRAMNLGGETNNLGAPVVISSGVLIDDPLEHDRLLRENPPIASVPAQDPTPLKEYEEAVVPVGTVRQVPAQGGPSSVRRVDDRTPDSALESARQPYNADTSAAQVSSRTGRDTTEEVAEGKYTEGGVKGTVAALAEEEAAQREQYAPAADESALEGPAAAPDTTAQTRPSNRRT